VCKQALRGMLRASSELIEAMLEIMQLRRYLQTAINIIEFQQMLVQALWIKVRRE
jgi:hypothetical protein